MNHELARSAIAAYFTGVHPVRFTAVTAERISLGHFAFTGSKLKPCHPPCPVELLARSVIQLEPIALFHWGAIRVRSLPRNRVTRVSFQAVRAQTRVRDSSKKKSNST